MQRPYRVPTVSTGGQNRALANASACGYSTHPTAGPHRLERWIPAEKPDEGKGHMLGPVELRTAPMKPSDRGHSDGVHRLSRSSRAHSVVRVTMKAAGANGRSAARRAAEAVARRAEAIARRETELLALATEFHVAAESAQKVRAAAQAKAQRILHDAQTKADALREQGEKDAAGFDEQAGAAVRDV
jgi:hypothetical protein